MCAIGFVCARFDFLDVFFSLFSFSFFVEDGRCICMHFVTIHRNNAHIWVCFYWCVKMRVWEDWWSKHICLLAQSIHTVKIWGSREKEWERNERKKPHLCAPLECFAHLCQSNRHTFLWHLYFYSIFTSLSPVRVSNALDFFLLFFCYCCYLSMICNSCFSSSFSFACTFCFACVCGWSRSRSSTSAIHFKYELKQKKNRHTHTFTRSFTSGDPVLYDRSWEWVCN